MRERRESANENRGKMVTTREIARGEDESVKIEGKVSEITGI